MEGEAQGKPLHAHAAAALCVVLKKQLLAAKGPDEMLRSFNDVGKVMPVSVNELLRLTARVHEKAAKTMKGRDVMSWAG